MHTTSGLLEATRSRRPHARAGRGRRCSPTSSSTCPRPQGAAVRQLDRHRPLRSWPATCRDLDDHLHYRMIDVSSIKELARRWYPRAYLPRPDEERRPPRARRHPREHQGAPLLPRHRLRPAAGAGHRRPRGSAAAELTPAPSASPARAAFDSPLDRSHSCPAFRRSAHGGCSSAGRAPGCGPGCRGFKSRHSPQFYAGHRPWSGNGSASGSPAYLYPVLGRISGQTKVRGRPGSRHPCVDGSATVLEFVDGPRHPARVRRPGPGRRRRGGRWRPAVNRRDCTPPPRCRRGGHGLMALSGGNGGDSADPRAAGGA